MIQNVHCEMNSSLPIPTEIINVTATESSMIYTNAVHILIPADNFLRKREGKKSEKEKANGSEKQKYDTISVKLNSTNIRLMNLTINKKLNRK